MAINFELSSLDTGELYKALTKAQVNFEVCTKDADNPYFKSKYALYEDLLSASRAALAEQGLCAISKVLHIDGDVYSVLELHHGASQQFTRCWQKLEPTKRDMQGFSGAHSYWRRVMFRDLLGIICSDEDDDDGNYGSNSVPNNKSNSANNKLGQKAADIDISDPKSDSDNNKLVKKAADAVITSNELAQLEEKLIDAPERRADFLEYFKITDLSQLKQSQYVEIISSLNKRASK